MRKAGRTLRIRRRMKRILGRILRKVFMMKIVIKIMRAWNISVLV